MRPRIITLLAYNRAKYLRRVLTGLSSCEGIETYVLLPFVEPGCEEVWDMAKRVSFCECRPTLNQHQLGVNLNTYKALEIGFANADFVIHMEDDVVPSLDTLRFFEYCRDAYYEEDEVLTITAYNNTQGVEVGSDMWYALGRRAWFTPWGWATWRNRWKGLRHRWVPPQHDISWDVWFNTRARGDGLEVYPHLSRTQNIGAEGGVHVPSPEWHAENQYNSEWAGRYDVARSNYFEQK